MPRRTWFAMILGAIVGSFIGIGVLALAASRVVNGGLGAVLDPSGRNTPVFAVSQGAMHLLVLVAGALAGSVLGLIGYAVGREAAPDEPRFSPGPLALIGGAAGAVIGFATTRAAVGAGGSIEAGIVTLSVFRATLVALIAGAVTGAMVGGTIERVSRTEAIGIGGEAWPRSPGAFIRDAVTAMGLPALGIGIGAAVVYGLSRVLLEAGSTVGLIVFGGAAAAILAGAALIASTPRK